MGLFGNKGKKILITGTMCQICGMSFAATDRLMRHMIKAHGKTKKDYGPSCPNCQFSRKLSFIVFNWIIKLLVVINCFPKLFMQKVLNVWLSEGRDIDDEKFWDAVDYNKQFDYPVEYYER